MKSTEQIPNRGKYNVSKSITHELNQISKPPVKKVITSHSASTYVKAAVAAATASVTTTTPHNKDKERNKWAISNTRNTHSKSSPTNARKSGTVGAGNKPNDWFMSARTFNVKSTESAKDILRLAATNNIASASSPSPSPSSSSRHSNNSDVEIVSDSHINHSNSVKAPVTNKQGINASNGQHQLTTVESLQHLWMPAVSVQQQQQHQQQQQQPMFKASACYTNRPPAKANNPLNGIGETNPVQCASISQKITTNQILAAGTTQWANKQIDSGKTRKNAPTERKYKQKDAKSIHEKRKNGGVGKHPFIVGDGNSNSNSSNSSNRKCVTNQMVHHESLQRLPLQRNGMNDPATDTTITTTTTTPNNITKCAATTAACGKRIIDSKEWHSPESYIYDEITAADVTSECPEQMSCMQTFWFRDLPNGNLLTREQRLENKRDNLRRQAFQYAQAQHFRSTMLAKRRLITVTKALAKFKNERNM